MAYTSWKKVRELNRKRYDIDFPLPPEDYRETKEISNMERAALAFIRDLCEDLRFDPERADCTDSDGNGIQPGLIPYNMEKDNDRLCLERAVHSFMQSGAAEDAFAVYVCFLEMFVGPYGKSKKMIEMLAEFEQNASSLLLKHRDHYSHSVYVFLLGLAVYYENKAFQSCYEKEYGFEEEQGAACHYLKYWGLTSLFHDIGYPFELPFEQVKSYFGGTIKDVPFLVYHGVREYARFSDDEAKRWSRVFGEDERYQSIDDLLAERIAARLEGLYKKSRTEIRDGILAGKASSPESFDGYMDHAYFSGIILYRQLVDVTGLEALTKDAKTAGAYADVLTAILLHNSLFKFGIKEKKEPLPMGEHPLAFMLMLCDELQCWDRMAYGQNSRRQLHPMDCDLLFSGHRITARYEYDRYFEERKDQMEGTYRKMTAKPGEDSGFLKGLKEIVETGAQAGMEWRIEADFQERKKSSGLYLSDSNYIHLYHFGVVVHGRNKYTAANVEDRRFFLELEAYFDSLPLEYKMSVLRRTKSYAQYLDRLGYFYTDRCVGYEIVREFTARDKDELGNMEHERWIQEKHEMGWHSGTKYLQKNNDRIDNEKKARELTRTHFEIDVPYKKLPVREQEKDTDPLYKMFRLLEEYDGLRIYRIPGYKKSDERMDK